MSGQGDPPVRGSALAGLVTLAPSTATTGTCDFPVGVVGVVGVTTGVVVVVPAPPAYEIGAVSEKDPEPV